MSESKQGGQIVYLVVDREGGFHHVAADRMLTDGPEVTFTTAGREVGSFNNPVSAKVSAPDVAPVDAASLAMGEACVTSIYSSERALFWPMLALATLSAISVALKAYELFLVGWLNG